MPAQLVQKVTGPKRTQRWSFLGTDLGAVTKLPNGDWGIFFGDTFDEDRAGGPGWRSPVMVRSKTDMLDDGIQYSSASGGNRAKEIINYTHDTSGHGEFTLIPTDAITIGNRTWLSFVSVRHWDRSRSHASNHAGLAYSDDNGENWVRTNFTFQNVNGNERTQMWTFAGVENGKLLIASVQWGREGSGGPILMRVPVDKILDKSKYEFWGWHGDRWAWGGHYNPIFAHENFGATGEISIRKIQNKYIMMYFDEANYRIASRTADAFDGVWSPPRLEISGQDLPQLYGGYIHPASTLDNVHFLVSQWVTSSGSPYHVLQYKTSFE